MSIEIFYNKNFDEFSLDLSLEMRLKKYISKNFPIAYVISALAPVYLVGGSIRDLIYAKEPKDLDFVVLGKNHLDWVLEVFEKYNIDYKFNRLGGYKFLYRDVEIDLWLSNDLFSSIQYNVDGIFFELQTNRLISFTFEDFMKNNLRVVNRENNIENGRKEKLIKFSESYFNK